LTRQLYLPTGSVGTLDLDDLPVMDTDIFSSDTLRAPLLQCGERLYAFRIAGIAPLLWKPYLVHDQHHCSPLD